MLSLIVRQEISSNIAIKTIGINFLISLSNMQADL